MAAVAESREHVRAWLPFADAHQTVEESRDWIIQGMAAWLLRDELRLSIWELGADRFLGGIGLHPRNWDSGYFEIGYCPPRPAEGPRYRQPAVPLPGDFPLPALPL